MRGYYDYHPAFFLTRPVALYGAPGTDAATVGYGLSALTGLPFVDVDRRVEHELGCHLSRAMRREGGHQILSAYKTVVRRALGEMPHGIWAMSNLILDYQPIQRLLVKHTDAVIIEKSIFLLYDDLKQDPEAYPPRHPELSRYEKGSTRNYKNFIDNIEQNYPESIMRIDGNNRSPNDCAREIFQWLERRGVADLNEQHPPPTSNIRRWLKL